MDRRLPSKSSALTSRAGIRHRSGVFNPTADASSHVAAVVRRTSLSDQSERTDHTLTVQVEDTDDATRQAPTVLLVRRSIATSRVKPLPGLPGEEFLNTPTPHHVTALALPAFGSPSLSPIVRNEAEAVDDPALSPVPLTPRPLQPDGAPSASSMQSAGSHPSEVSRLPTPDYPSGTGLGRRLSTYFPRMLSLRARPVRAPAPPPPPPPVARTESGCSTYSEESTAMSDHARTLAAGSAVAGRVPAEIKDRRPMFTSALGTNDKFTRKFPRPRSVKNLSFSGQSAVGGHGAMAANMLEEGEGLGFEMSVGKWTLHKWCLVLSVCTILVYGTAGLVCALLTWFRAWDHADVMYVADYDLLVLITLAASILLLTFLVGISGALLNSRPLLAVYALLLWPALLALLAVGYTAYKRSAFALDRKLNLAWSQWYTPRGRAVVQDSLRCCGFYSALHEAAPSARCYPRSPLPGCKGKLLRFERANLAAVWGAVFALVPLHVVNIAVALLCANHVTRAFGKGLTPKRYRLSGDDVRADAEALMKVLKDVRPVARPGFSRAPTSGVFREDKAYYDSLEDWETDTNADTVGLGIRRR